ncbi:hypothetical protein NKH89_33765 [Mesorhizobium sp. M0923]|uniref:hypothetical protein n=1 Tax=Mesorhizobium sp. M0923 TaxID=2957028 RepID=UPI00333DD54F
MTVDYHVLNWLAVALAAFAAIRAYQGLRGPFAWFWAMLAFGISSTVLVTSLSSLGLIAELKRAPDESYSLMYQLVLLESAAMCGARFLLGEYILSRLVSANMPVISIPPKAIVRIITTLTIAAAVVQIGLQLTGYTGYFRAAEYSTDPPPWLDLVKKIISIGYGLFFILSIVWQAQNRRRLLYVVCGLWVFSGLLSGYKSAVFLPIAMIGIASWMIGRFQARFIVWTFLAVLAAYSIIEPLRKYRDDVGGVGASSAFARLSESGEELNMFSIENLTDRVIRRYDYSDITARALLYSEVGQLPTYTQRLQEMYRRWFTMAFIPRYFSKEKPLANLGSVLSYEITGNDQNSIGAIRSAGVFIAGGYLAVLGAGFVVGSLLTLASVLMYLWLKSPIRLVPLFLLALALSRPSDIALFSFISAGRSIATFAGFVVTGKVFGFVVSHRPNGLFGNRTSLPRLGGEPSA